MCFPLTWSLAISKSVQGLGGSVVKNPPARQEKQVGSLDRKDPLEESMATHSTILAWRIPWTATVDRVAKNQTRLKQFYTRENL